jgi:Ferredoxin-like domain in Api92-like protein
MPNWCDNTLSISGPADKVDAFMEGVLATEKISENGRPSILKAWAPLDGEWEYEKAIEHWGVKWSDNVREFDPSNGGCEHDTLNFETPWGPPIAGIEKVSKAFPELTFSLAWVEFGMAFYGMALFKNGECDIREEGDLPDFYYGDGDWDRSNRLEMEFLDALFARNEALCKTVVAGKNWKTV